MQKHILGIDLGATSGRVILATVSKTDMHIEELHRFPNKLTNAFGRYYWNIYELFDHIKEGLQLAAKKSVKIDSIGVDTWGVDFVFVGADGQLLGLPRAYRDPYTKDIPEEFFTHISREKVYDKTGIQIMNFNSLYQLYAANKEENSALHAAKHILFVPDAISYLLTGKMVCEYTILSTSQFLNPQTKQIDDELLAVAGVRSDMFPEIVYPGHVIGYLTPQLSAETGLGEVPIIAVAGHDTASAVAAVPAIDENYAYLSSGTWSLMGIEAKQPIINDDSYKFNFTNEGGVEGSTRFLKNITGMWLLEQCRLVWAAQGHSYSYGQIVEMTQNEPPTASLIDPDDACFASPVNMLETICAYCSKNGLPVPQTDAALMRCIFDSLAHKYKLVLDRLKDMAPFKIERLHVIGGGAQNDLLNQLTANSIDMPVMAGPVEATAIGNVMLQAKALGIFSSIAEMRAFIHSSVNVKEYMPQ